MLCASYLAYICFVVCYIEDFAAQKTDAILEASANIIRDDDATTNKYVMRMAIAPQPANV